MEYNREALVEVLVYHWRTDTSGCGCGWAVLGHSHSEHVANVYEDALKNGLFCRNPECPRGGHCGKTCTLLIHNKGETWFSSMSDMIKAVREG